MKRLVHLTAFVALQLLALELTLWAFFSLRQDYDAEMWRYSRLLKRNVTDDRGHVHQADGSAKLMGVNIATDGHGLRTFGEAGPRELLVVGDSFTLGWGVESAAAYPALLSRCQRAFNAGVGNYNLPQVAAAAARLVPELKPKAVLYGFYWNDAEPLQREPDAFLARNSHLALFWRKIQVRLLHYGGKPQSYLDYYGATFEGEDWDRFRAGAGRLAAAARAGGAPLYVALLPELRTPDEPRIRAIYAKVDTLFRSLGARTVNLFGTLPPVPSPADYWAAPDDPHPNAAAHRHIADSIRKSFWPKCAPL